MAERMVHAREGAFEVLLLPPGAAGGRARGGIDG